MKIPAGKADSFSRSPDPSVRAVLVYGPDEGLVQERARNLLLSVVDDPGDPFRVVELEGDLLKKDGAVLADEAAAISMVGGRRVIRLRQGGDAHATIFSSFLDNPAGDALIIVEAGDLPARSKLRKAFEGDKLAAALPCYKDDEKFLPAVIRQTIENEGFSISNDALAFLVSNLGTDRRLTRQEAKKLCLYKGINSSPIELEDAVACVGDTAALTLDDLAMAVSGGNIRELERGLQRAQQEGQNAVTILRALSRHFQKLHFVSGLIAQGLPLDQAVGSLRPPLFWKVAAPFKAQVSRWPLADLSQALSKLMETEANCKKTGAPADTLCARVLLEIAAKAPTRRR